MSRPIGVTVVAVVMMVLGVFTLLLGLEGAGITNFGLKQLAPQGGLYANTVIFSGILTLIAAFGLFTLARWAWYLAVIVLIAFAVTCAYVFFRDNIRTPANTPVAPGPTTTAPQ